MGLGGWDLPFPQECGVYKPFQPQQRHPEAMCFEAMWSCEMPREAANVGVVAQQGLLCVKGCGHWGSDGYNLPSTGARLNSPFCPYNY